MTKFILTASILSLLIAPDFAAEEGFFSKLEQGIKAEANTQLQGAVGATIKGNLPPSAQRAVKPAANELVAGAVDVSSSAIKHNNIQNIDANGPSITEAQSKKVTSPVKVSEPALPSATSSVPAILAHGTDALYAIPKPKIVSKYKRQCSAWIGDGKDCMPDSINANALKAQFPELKERAAARLGIMTTGYELEAWAAVYDSKIGKIDMAKATEQQIRRLGLAVERSNELIEKGIIHPDTVTFRECLKRGAPITPWGKARTKAEVCS